MAFNMNRLLTVAILAISVAPLCAQGQQPDIAKLKVDAQKVVSIIRGDKVKNQTYCHIVELTDELDEMDEQKNRKEADELSQKIGELEKTLGPEYLALANGLKNIDPKSQEGQEIDSTLASLDQTCED
jgi:hypothetical protein